MSWLTEEKLSSLAVIARPLLMTEPPDPCKRYWVPDGAFEGLPPRELGAEVPVHFTSSPGSVQSPTLLSLALVGESGCSGLSALERQEAYRAPSGDKALWSLV